MRGLLYIARLFLLFLFAFALSRLIFICFFFTDVSHEPASHILAAFFYGLKTDSSAACYLLIIPVLFLLEDSVGRFAWASRLQSAYALLILFINALVTSAELGLYREWGVKMNYRALLYLQHPSEVLSTATTWQILLTLFLTAIQTGITCYAYKRWVKLPDTQSKDSRVPAFIISLLMIPAIMLGMRGGWQQIPVQASDSYYSGNEHLNWAAVNSLWSLGQSISVGTRYGISNPYDFYLKDIAEKTVSRLYATQGGPGLLFLKDRHPNIVFIIFEGWSADLLSSISGDTLRSAAPHFDRLAAQGILFTHCLASGERSDQGLSAILSGFPSLPLASIVNYPEKINHLPALLKPFSHAGYSSLFLFGGQLSYGNIKALIYHNNFDEVIEEKDIDRAIYRGRLGVHDENTFDILRHKLSAKKQPFFAGFFTQSTHFSYDYPKAKKLISWAGDMNDYVNSLMYADSCLGDFFEKAKREPWYANTLFILVSDHSHVLPWDNDHKTSALHHIPLLFYGDAIKEQYRGMRKDEVVSQQDICATLLQQAGMPHSDFKWSKDIMNPGTLPFAYWTFTNGFGFTRSNGCELVYDLGNKKTISDKYEGCDSASITRSGFSYLQSVFDDFLSMDKQLDRQK
jgi:phosphoglycerol transferase MdoB-like AlkP superfamily enzyme